jgi:hypothetical protein
MASSATLQPWAGQNHLEGKVGVFHFGEEHALEVPGDGNAIVVNA